MVDLTYEEASKYESFIEWMRVNGDSMLDFFDYYADDCVIDGVADSLAGFNDSLAFMWGNKYLT